MKGSRELRSKMPQEARIVLCAGEPKGSEPRPENRTGTKRKAQQACPRSPSASRLPLTRKRRARRRGPINCFEAESADCRAVHPMSARSGYHTDEDWPPEVGGALRERGVLLLARRTLQAERPPRANRPRDSVSCTVDASIRTPAPGRQMPTRSGHSTRWS